MASKQPSENKTSPDEIRWQAVQLRDAAADQAFVYAVKTTGIYCRPSCPSRRPLAKNVEFFDTAKVAADNGYRPCKRCEPDTQSAGHRHRKKILDACRFIEKADERPTLKQLAGRAGMSPYHFQRVFKSIVGLTPKQYEKAQRERRVRGQLTGSRSVTNAIFDSGYQSSGRFYADAPNVVGMPPARRRARGKGETVRFAVGRCSLGDILVAATDKGICAISLGDDPNALVESFETDFADAEVIGADAAFETLVANVVGLIENPRQRMELPLDIRGTAFQKKVWRALTKIRSGDTASYTEIARMIGKPTAVRAVAQACGANRLAVAIPCHRVVRRDGSLSGYRWGVERKRQLLDREKVA